MKVSRITINASHAGGEASSRRVRRMRRLAIAAGQAGFALELQRGVADPEALAQQRIGLAEYPRVIGIVAHHQVQAE